MLQGTADPNQLARRVPALSRLDTEPLVLEEVETFQLLSEIDTGTVASLLPPGLHPTLPGVVNWSVQRVGTSPWGEFHLAQTRIECRSGLRPRVYLVSAVCDSVPAAAALAERWGYTVATGSVDLDRHYDRIDARVAIAGTTILSLVLHDPEPLRPGDVQYMASMNLARTPRGLRLVQVDPDFEVVRAERGRPEILAFDAAAWGSADLRPVYPISASLTVGRMTLPRLRFLCQPDRLAFDGTERVD